MPECSHTTTVHAPLEQTWAFVREMDNWAPLLTGYQSHTKIDDKTSTWTLRGDVGMLSREVELLVEITEWLDGERVSFTLHGVNEQVDGDGTFEIVTAEVATAPVSAHAEPSAADKNTEIATSNAHKPTIVGRFFAWLAKLLFRAQHGEEPLLEAVGPPVEQQVSLKFRLRMDAGGPMAPMLNALLQPALLPATEDLAQKIANEVLRRSDGGATGSAAATPSGGQR